MLQGHGRSDAFGVGDDGEKLQKILLGDCRAEAVLCCEHHYLSRINAQTSFGVLPARFIGPMEEGIEAKTLESMSQNVGIEFFPVFNKDPT